MAVNKVTGGAACATLIGALIVLFLITPWIVMLILGALAPQWGVAFWQAILGCWLLGIVGRLFNGGNK